MVSRVYVSTDSSAIADLAKSQGVDVVMRPAELATDVASSESALLHVLDERRKSGLKDPDLVVFLQCTSPIRRKHDIDGAIKGLLEADADSLFSGYRDSPFVWERHGEALKSLTYDFEHRGRTQERATQYVENGSIFVCKPWVLRKLNNRLGGRIAIYEMDFWTSIDIDTSDHVALVEQVLQRPEFTPELKLPKRIELVVFDFDGVMTDNAVFIDKEGNELVRCLRGDGLGISELRKAGLKAIVLSTEENKVVSARCAKLQLDCYQGISDKGAFLSKFLSGHKIDSKNVIYLGNDINDIGCLDMVGFPVVVADADSKAAAKARLILSKSGGAGAVRELCDLILQHVINPALS
jgi:YrbI family 3-deoxy-D-manno-octulosonate 8-phosphate phosphatase